MTLDELNINKTLDFCADMDFYDLMDHLEFEYNWSDKLLSQSLSPFEYPTFKLKEYRGFLNGAIHLLNSGSQEKLSVKQYNLLEPLIHKLIPMLNTNITIAMCNVKGF